MSGLIKRLFGIKPADLNGKPVVVKVECRATGNTADSFDCGTDQRLADKKTSDWLKKYPESTHHVYQSFSL